MAQTLPRFVWLALAVLPACHPPGSRAELPAAPANPEHARLVAALRNLCAPKFAPLERPTWSRDQLKINLFDKVELSDQDIEEVLALAAAEGLTEPVELSAGNRVHPGRNFQVWVTAPVEEDAESQTRTERTLCITCPDWETKRPYYPASNGGGWKLARAFWAMESPWHEWKTYCVRDGDAVWEFDMSRSLPRAEAIELLQAIGERKYLIDDGLDLGGEKLAFSDGWLGWITKMRDWRDSLSPRPSPEECEWDLQLGLTTSRWTGVEFNFSQRNGIWILVESSSWIS
jgi:hypothetical protein